MSANFVRLRAPQRRFQHLKAQDFDGFVKVPGIDAVGSTRSLSEKAIA